MSAVEADMECVIDLFYEAALDFNTWPLALHRFARAVNAKGGVMLPLSAPTALLSATSADLLDAVPAYMEEWWRHDFMIFKAIERRISKGVFTFLDLVDGIDIGRNPFFQEFRRDHDLGGMIAQVTQVTGTDLNSPLIIALNFGRGKLVPSEAERLRFDLLSRHLQRAVKVGARFASSLALGSSLAGAMQNLTFGLAIADAEQKVVFANERFESLARGGGLRIVHSRLVAPQPSQQARLDRAIAEAIAKTKIPSTANALALRRASGKPLHVRVIPLSPRAEKDFAAFFDKRFALVVATDPDDDTPVGLADMLACGLTPAEAKVARLIGAGHSPAEAALKLGNSEATVRTLLKRVYSKLGLNRQAQLATLVARLSVVE